jgi:hypothetical protein
MLDVIYAECRKLAHYAECLYAECRYPECRYAECHYAECHYAECRGALLPPISSELEARQRNRVEILKHSYKELAIREIGTYLKNLGLFPYFQSSK